MSFSKPFILYTVDEDRQTARIYKPGEDLTLVSIPITEFENYTLDYACIRIIAPLPILFQYVHLSSGRVFQLDSEIYQFHFITNVGDEDIPPLYFNFNQIEQNLPHYQFANFVYRDLSKLIAEDLRKPDGVLPRYIAFGGEDIKEEIERKLVTDSWFEEDDINVINVIRRMAFIRLHKQQPFVTSLSSNLKFNNSTIPDLEQPGRYITAFRVVQHLQYTEYNIHEDDGYIHIPPMWAKYKYLGHPGEIHGAGYIGMDVPINGGWNSYSYVMIIYHDYNQIFNYKILSSSKDGVTINPFDQLEDPRLYYVNNRPYLYTISMKPNDGVEEEKCGAKLNRLERNDCNRGCVIVEEVSLDRLENDYCNDKICTYNNTFNIMCDLSHKGIQGVEGNCRLFEKNYIPFDQIDREGILHRYIIYMSTPFQIYEVNRENISECQVLGLTGDTSVLRQLVNTINSVTIDVTGMQELEIQQRIYDLRQVFPDGVDLIGTEIYVELGEIFKISQTGPAIHFAGDNEYIAPMHVRINRRKYENYMTLREQFGLINLWINTNLKPFYDRVEQLYHKGDTIYHDDIYLNMLIQFKFEIPNHRFTLQKISNPFLFHYYHQKFTLQFNSSIALDYDNNIIFSFGEGDVSCRDVIMGVDSVVNDLLIYDFESNVADNLLTQFRPVFMLPKNTNDMFNSIATTKKELRQVINENYVNMPKVDNRTIRGYFNGMEEFFSR